MKYRLRGLIAYLQALEAPALLLGQDMRLVYSNQHLKALKVEGLMEKVMDCLFSKKQSVSGFQLTATFIARKKVHAIVFHPCGTDNQSVAMGKEFIANASHELRTPITIIKGFAETLEDMQDISIEMHSSIIHKIINSCNRMQSLIKNLLILSDLDQTSHLKKNNYELMSLVEKAIEELLHIHPNTRIECYYEKEPIEML